MIPPYTYIAGRMAEERRHDVLRDGEHAYLMRRAKPVKISLYGRALARASDILIATGEKLQEHCVAAQAGVNQSVLRTNH